MPITTQWYDKEQRVISQVYEGSWTWDELNRESAQMRALAGSVSHSVILFSDMSETSFMPKGNVLSQGRSIIQKVPNNVSLIVIVLRSRMLEVFTSMAIDMVPHLRKRIKFVKTIAEGEKAVAAALAAQSTHSSNSH